MRKNEFLSSRAVIEFASWMESILDAPQAFVHGYFHNKERKSYEFENLFSAYEKYNWTLNDDIDALSAALSKSLAESDEKSCESICYRILKWGGVSNRGNNGRLSRLSSRLCPYLHNAQKRLSEDLSSIEYYENWINMTSGFSKIYSALMPDFMIYDSRVAAALGLLVRHFCIGNNLTYIPSELRFAWTSGLGNHLRNPSNDKYSFPKLRIYKEGEYLENNIRANWLMSCIAQNTNSRFAEIDRPKRLRALEQSLFMIGYDIAE